MSSREQRLSWLVGGFLMVAVVGIVFWFLIWTPLTDKNREADTLSSKNLESEAKLAKIRKELPRLQTAIKRSLPNDPGAAQEYDAVISRMLRDAKVPAGAYTVKPKAVDGKATPEVAPKKPAFTRVGLEIQLKKVNFAMVLDVLKAYYKLNLLQQITSFTLKRTEDKDGPALRGSLTADKADLEMTIVTEAITLDGAETRRSLLPVPIAFGALGGGAGEQMMAYSPEPARGMTPLQLAQVLSSGDREYAALLVKDLFHGPPPLPLPPPEKVVVAPKEDTSEFIRITALGRNSDGSGSAVIEDLASKQEYAIDVRWTGGKLTPEVTKYYYTPKGLRKSFEAEADLDISESSSGTARRFRIVGFHEDGLLVAEKEVINAAPTSRSVASGATRRPGSPPASSKTPPLAAVAGGAAWVVGPPLEIFFLWKAGQALAGVQELRGPSLEKALLQLSPPLTTDIKPEAVLEAAGK